MRTSLAVLLTGIVLFAGCTSQNQAVRTQRKPVLVDEYSALDDNKGDKPLSSKMLKRKLEEARRNYILAMRASDQHNTAVAARHFEAAMAILNDLVTYPDIYDNPEFTKLSESLVQDYEEQITSIDSLDANSSFFVLRDKIFKEVERIPVERKNYPSKAQIAENAAAPSEQELQIALTDNTPVQQCISYFTSERGRRFFSNWLANSGRYFPLYEQIFAEEGVPQELRYLSMIESGLSPSAVSWAKAVGLWQFIPATGQHYGLTINWWVDERRDPVKATRAAARYLRDLYNDLGDWHLALASYNCGPGRVKSAIAKANSRDYWVVRQYLPRETQQYVPLYIAAAKITMNPDNYGFTNINYKDPDEFDTVPVEGAYELTAVSKAAGVGIDQIKALNPELLRDRLPQLNDRPYTLRMPKGAGRDLAARLEDLQGSQPLAESFITHKVGRGETTKSIAGKYGVSISAINDANELTSKTKLRNGMTLKIPMGTPAIAVESPALASKSDEDQSDAPAAESNEKSQAKLAMAGPQPTVTAQPRRETVAPSRPVQNARSEKPSAPQKPALASHKVQRGESLTSIAKKYNVSLADLADWNGIERNTNVRMGQTLKLRQGAAIASKSNGAAKKDLAANDTKSSRNGKRAVTTTSTRFETHKVRKGESLTSIADRYGVSVDDLKAWNGKDTKGGLQAGAALKIYSETSAKGDTRRTSRAAKTSVKKYTVRKGDSMAEIANKFGVSLKDLKKNNPKLSEKTIKAGQTVTIGK